MDRRNFLLNGAAAAAAFAIPEYLHANSKDPIIGHNHKRYRLNKNWGKLDAARYPVKDCHEMVMDNKGRIILLTNETKNNILIYDRSGKLVKSWGTQYPGGHGLTIFDENGTENLYICDNNLHQVIKTDLDGKVHMKIGYPVETREYANENEFIPTETAIAPNGDIYVADGYGKDFIIQYDQSGKYIRHFGGRGNEPKHLKNAHGVCIDSRDKNNISLIVCSREENAFKIFSLEGEYKSTIEIPGAWVCRPVIKGNYLYAAVLQSSSNLWKESGFITILDKTNTVISNPGGTRPEYISGKLSEVKQAEKVFSYPHDVCIDDDENIYLAQWNSGKVYPYKLSPV